MKKLFSTTQSFTTFEDQSVNFVELFFDLVFVFSVTQIVGILHHGFSWESVGQSTLIFWLVWWAWTQFTWALNGADTTHSLIKLATLAATAITFFMAIAVPEAFGGRGLWFAAAYVLVRLIGILISQWASSHDVRRTRALRRFILISAGGFVAILLGGWLGGIAQYLLWGITIVIDMVASTFSAQQAEEDLSMHPEHFTERHGLFVIIALGETLIVAGSGIIGEAWTGPLLAVAMLAVGLTCALWWSYFHQAKPALDHALGAEEGLAQGKMATVVFSFLHFPMLLGVISFAYAIEEAIAHPSDPLSSTTLLAFALGLALFVGGMVLCQWRAKLGFRWPRTLAIGGTVATILLLVDVAPVVTLGIAFVGLVLIAFWEQVAGNSSLSVSRIDPAIGQSQSA
ncbi:MAG: low temperature requirement protein A [Chloroflexota bacterium]